MKKVKNILLAGCLMAFTASSFAINTVQMREQQGGPQVDFSSGKPQFKKGVIIRNGQSVEYNKCQYINPDKPNDPPAQQGVPYCPAQ